MSQKHFIYEERVRFSDTDGLGIVNNIAFFYFMEAARIEFWRKKGFTVASLAKRKLTLAVARQSCEYLAPVYYDEVMRTEVSVKNVGESSFALGYTMRVKRKIVARGEIVLVCIGVSDRQPMGIPRHIKRQLLS